MANRENRVAATDAGTPAVAAAIERLRAQGVSVVSQDGGGDVHGDVAVLVAGSVTAIGPDILKRYPRLQLVIRTGAGYENVDVDGLRACGVEVARAAGRNVESVAEFTFAGLLALLRHVREADVAVRSGDFGYRQRVLGRELSGRTMGVLGFGPIGRRVAEIAMRGFGMAVVVHHPWRRPADLGGAELVDDVRDFLTRADVLSIHCRLTEESRGMIGADELALLGGDGLLVNTARGEIVDIDALTAALVAGTIAGAVLDVFPDEPPDPKSPLFDAPNLLVSPHLAGHTREGVTGNGSWAADVAIAFLSHRQPPPGWSLCPGREVRP